MKLHNTLTLRIVIDLKAILKKWLHTYWFLLKVMLPAMLVMQLFQHFNLIDDIARIFEPIMSFVGLPASTALIWITGMFANIYAAGAVFATLGSELQLSVAQASVLSVMILGAHSLFIEQSIIAKTGCRLGFSTLFRIGVALLMGYLLSLWYQLTSFSQHDSVILWENKTLATTWSAWLINSLNTLFTISWILLVLLLVLYILDKMGLNALLEKLLSPLLRYLNIEKEATSITIVGFLLGLSYGGGLMINEVEKDHLSHKTIFMSMSLLMVMHSFIEDVLLVVSFGADWKAMIFFRLFIGGIFLLGWAYVVKKIPYALFYKLFYKPIRSKVING